MKYKFLLFLTLILNFNAVLSQGIEKVSLTLKMDTLKLNKKDYLEPQKLKTSLDFIYDNFRTDIGNSINICTFLYNRSSEIKNKALMASALNIKASVYALKNDFSNATKLYLEAADLFNQVNQSYSTAMMYNNIGMMYNNTNNKKLALQYFQKGIQISEEKNLEKPKAHIYVNLANLYITVGKLDEALDYATKANIATEKLNMKIEQAINGNLIGAIYFYKNDFDKALEYYRLAVKLSVEANDNHTKNSALINIAEVLAMQKNPETLTILNSSEKYFTDIKDYSNLQQVYTHYTNYYKNTKDFEKTINYLNKLRETDGKLNDSIQKKSIVFYQTKYETQQKENKIVLLSKTDSINKLKISKQQLSITQNLLQLARQKLVLSGAQLQIAENDFKIANQSKTILRTQLETAKKQQKINVLSKEALQQKIALQEKQIAINQKNSTIGVIATIATFLLLLSYGFFRKKQLEQKAILATEQTKQRELLAQAVIQAEETERKRIASDLHDGVGQLFSAVKMNLNGLLDRIEFTKDDDKFLAEKTIALVDESCKEVRVMSHKMMPNFLLKSGIAADIKSFIEKIDENALKISFESIGFKDQLEFNEEVVLYRVIQELINNVIKHAKANELSIVLQKTNQAIEVKISDNGIGFNFNDAIEKGGLGLKNILIRIEYLKGTVRFEPNNIKGTKVLINIPIA